MSTTELRPRASRRIRPGTARARAWNQRIGAVVRRDTSETLPFFCECGIEFCRDSVWLTLQEARELIERGEPIVSDHLVRELDACG